MERPAGIRDWWPEFEEGEVWTQFQAQLKDATVEEVEEDWLTAGNLTECSSENTTCAREEGAETVCGAYYLYKDAEQYRVKFEWVCVFEDACNKEMPLSGGKLEVLCSAVKLAATAVFAFASIAAWV